MDGVPTVFGVRDGFEMSNEADLLTREVKDFDTLVYDLLDDVVWVGEDSVCIDNVAYRVGKRAVVDVY